MHWLGGELKMIGSEKDCRAWAKKNSYNSEAPIYYSFPIAGITLQVIKHEHTHKEIPGKIKKVNKI